MGSILEYFSPQLILFLDSDSKEEALHQLIKILKKNKKLCDSKNFSHDIFEREKLVSTGIGNRIAIPHAKQPAKKNKDFFIAIGIQKSGIEWNSLDENPVKIVFMIGGPDNKPTEYLQLLATLTSLLKDEEMQNKILQLETPDEVFKLFKKKLWV